MFAIKCRWFVPALFVIAALARPGLAQPSPQQPQEGVLLLKHGATLRGFITPAGDRYIVLLGESGEVRVPAADVAAVVNSLPEAYEFKRSVLDDRLASRIDLAQWCLQHQMPARAADQLLAAERLFGQQPQLELLHQRLLASAKVQPSSGEPAEMAAVIAKVSFEEELSGFPSGTIESFTSTVQPLLLNRCASGGCHNTRGTSAYVMFRPFLGQATTRRLTERNLQATLAYIDRAAPLESILLSKAATPHGGAAVATVQEREQKQLAILEAWVRSLGARRQASEPTTIAPANELLFQPGWMANADSATAVTAGRSTRPPKVVAEPAGDPFDPALFNQRHHGRTQ
ncbi:MAG: hypothetical protein O3C40_15500 [Planctomycetota bacterium]|nr:hypothetical protein [Planctomycetota bacterium]